MHDRTSRSTHKISLFINNLIPSVNVLIIMMIRVAAVSSRAECLEMQEAADGDVRELIILHGGEGGGCFLGYIGCLNHLTCFCQYYTNSKAAIIWVPRH